MEGFFGYCGRYEIDAINHVIYHYRIPPHGGSDIAAVTYHCADKENRGDAFSLGDPSLFAHHRLRRVSIRTGTAPDFSIFRLTK